VDSQLPVFFLSNPHIHALSAVHLGSQVTDEILLLGLLEIDPCAVSVGEDPSLPPGCDPVSDYAPIPKVFPRVAMDK
jgi:hypothetical protein